MRKTPRGIGLNLALRLYLVLIAIVGPAMLIYYIFNQRTIENLHGREVGDLIQTVTRRMEDWAAVAREAFSVGDRERESLDRVLQKIVTTPVEGAAVFVQSGRDLDYVMGQGSSAPTRATPDDLDAALQRRVKEQDLQSGTVRLRAYSIPLFHRGVLRGVFRLICNHRLIENLEEREVENLIKSVRDLMEAWLTTVWEAFHVGDRERELLDRELQRIVSQSTGAVEGIALFVSSNRELTYVTSHGSSAPTRPTSDDLDAVAERRIKDKDIQSGTVRLYTYSIPLFQHGEMFGLLNLRVIPDRIGLASRLPELRAILLLGAGAMLVALVIGVVLFFHIAVRRPIAELTGAMGEAADGNLATLVRSRGGEFGWLSTAYNRMMRRLKSSVDENRQLLEQIRLFNEELQEKIRAATEELAAKNLQLQEVNERLFTTQRQMTTMEKLATLGQVATTIAHELGTPLNAISGHLQLLLEAGAADKKLVDRLKIIDGQVDRLTAIVKNVLRAMRVPPPKFEPVRMEEMIRREAELIEPVARKRKVAVELKVPPDLPVIPADPDQVEQILLNLYTNALDSMKEGGRLSVSARVVPPEEALHVSPGDWAPIENSSYLRVDVADTGVGMTEEMMARAFEPFFSSRSNDGNTAEPSGMGVGLGLAICREIVRNHKGEIVAASEVGRGTTFTFLLPVDNDNILIHK